MLYKVYLKNYAGGQASFLGALPERREKAREIPLVISALRWSKLIFGGLVRDVQALFVVPFDNGKEKGASTIEYALLACLIAAVIVVVVSALGESLEALFKLAAVLIPRR